MPKQELLNFPIRKTRGMCKAVETTGLELSPRRSTRHLKTEEETLTSPLCQRKAARLKGKTETKYISSSLPIKNNENTPPKATRRREQEVEGKSFTHEGSSPSKRTFKGKSPTREKKATPNACRRLLTEETSPSYPKKTSDCALALSPIKVASSDLISPEKTPLKSSSILNSPNKSPARTLFPCPQPVRCSPRKHTSLLKSPVKRLEYGSPKKSPRKLIQEDACSPRRSPRKLPGSPHRFMSPSSLVSRLTVSSPGKKMSPVLLGKPDVSAYRAIRQSLNTGTPSCLMCRETQICQMKKFLEDHVTLCKPGSLYISGAPGTGKTASLTFLLSEMKGVRMKKIYLNCMSLHTSGAIYNRVAEELDLDLHGTERDVVKGIEKYLQSAKTPVLIVLDEMDQLDSRNQEVLYTIFEWPALVKSKLILIGIANALDLTDRVLPRLQSRPTFKPKLLNFPPYTKPEIVKILNQRIEEAGLGEVQIIKPSAIMFLAAKVASVAGDVRKALDVCRRAVELCETQARRQSLLRTGSPVKSPGKRPSIKMVELPQIMSIFNEVYGSRVTTAVTQAPQSFPLQQKVLVCSLLLMLKHAKSKDITLGKLHTVYNNVCKKRNVQCIDQTEFLSVCVLLESRGILLVKKSKDVRSSKISLRLNAEEAEQALGDRNLLVSVMEDKESLGKLARA